MAAPDKKTNELTRPTRVSLELTDNRAVSILEQALIDISRLTDDHGLVVECGLATMLITTMNPPFPRCPASINYADESEFRDICGIQEDDMRAWLVDEYNAIEGPPNPTSKKGNKYLIITSGGVKPEGGLSPALYSTVEQAVKCWKQEVMNLSSQGRGCTVRAWPELRKEEARYVVYSRLVFE